MGDEIMVIWGAPVGHRDDPTRAVRAALEIMDELRQFNRKRAAAQRQVVEIGIGINTGTVVAGYIGSSQTMSYSVIGDTVNTASRLCAAAKAGQIIIAENTHACLDGLFDAVEIEPLRAKGKLEPIHVFDVAGEKGPHLSTADERTLSGAGLAPDTGDPDIRA